MKLYFRGLFTCALLFAGVLLTGCSSPTDPLPGLDNPPSRATTGSPSSTSTNFAGVARFRVGETVIVTFSGPPTPIDPHQEAIKEDGTITLPLIGPIYAVGKTSGQLQREIREAYVPIYYLHLTVTVSTKSEDRVVYVAGEVHNAGRVIYMSDMTVTKAIQAAGGFTDFASHSKVWLTRASTGQRIQVDYDKAVKDPASDPPVFPDDQIVVGKSW
jgi:protein involved in polysaccharide export with SLBB domain